ncbi:MAG: hypothetical protein ACJAVV_001311 [Alphaproteobacteria bacterium]
MGGIDDDIVGLIHVDHLLKELASFDIRAAKVYEPRIFAALNNSDIALVLGISLATAERDAKVGKAWLKTELEN